MTERQVSKKYRVLTDAENDAYDRVSFWTKAEDVETADGSNIEEKLGAIKGITSSTSVTETGYAADASTVSNLANEVQAMDGRISTIVDQKLAELNDALHFVRYDASTYTLYIKTL